MQLAALTSALTFALDAALPLLTVLVARAGWLIWAVGFISLICLGVLGRRGGTGGRCRSAARHHSRAVLGRLGDGDQGRDRRDFRRRRLSHLIAPPRRSVVAVVVLVVVMHRQRLAATDARK